MGIFGRIATLFKSEANAAIDKMEDPEKMLNQTIRDMQEQLATAKAQVAESIAFEKKLKIQYDKAVQNSKDWESRAMQAVNAGRDDLATQALARKAQYDQEASTVRVQWQKQKEGCDQIKAKLKAMNDKIEDAKRKKSLLVAQAKRAEAAKTINNTLSGLNDGGAFDTFDRMAEKVETMEAEAEAAEDLAGADIGGDSLANEFDKLGTTTVAESDALAALKAKMGKAPAAPAATNTGAATLSNATSWDDL